MANTTVDKLTKLNSTKAALKTSINGSGNIVGDVFADYPGAVDDFRSKVATAITAKGVPTAATDTPDQMAANIGSIETGYKIDTVKITNNSSSVFVYAIAYVNSKIQMIRIAKNGSFDRCIKGTMAFWESQSYSPSVTGDYTYEGIVFFSSDSVIGYPAYTINGDCVFNQRGGGGDN